MHKYPFHDTETLAEIAEQLGIRAVKLGLIPSFVVQHYADSDQFYIPNNQACEPLLAPEAYLHLKRLLETAIGTPARPSIS